MKDTEIYTKIKQIESLLYQLSEDVAKPIEPDGLDITYLNNKFTGVTNVAKHVADQLKFKKKLK
jgi:hypothetical protein